MTDQETKEDKTHRNINLPIIVPKLNVIFEDFIISVSMTLIFIGFSSVLQWLSDFLAFFVILLGVLFGIALLIFARRRRSMEIEERGVCRSGILRRWLEFYFGSDMLRGR